MIIGFSGKMGTGKSFYSQYTVDLLRQQGHQVLELGFGDQIKINTLVRGDDKLTRVNVYDKKDDYSRSLLQIEGTERGRAFDKDIWIKYVSEWIYLWSRRGIKHFVISDIRFPNELEFIKSFKDSYVFRIQAPSRNLKRLSEEYSSDVVSRIQNHPSETGLDNASFDCILDNDNIDSTQSNKDSICNTVSSRLVSSRLV
jgi:hypothetical protein